MLNLIIPFQQADLIPVGIRVGPVLINIVFVLLGVALHRTYVLYKLLVKQKDDLYYNELVKWFVIKQVSMHVFLMLLLMFMIYRL